MTNKLIIVIIGLVLFSCVKNNKKTDFENIVTSDESNNKDDIILYDNNKKLRETITITNYDVNKVMILVREICIRWNMLENKEYIIYPNQKLFFYQKFDDVVIEESNRLQYIVLYTSNDTIYIELQDFMTIKSKWFDNFTWDILNILQANRINYEIR